jgi:hypothetical protein
MYPNLLHPATIDITQSEKTAAQNLTLDSASAFNHTTGYLENIEFVVLKSQLSAFRRPPNDAQPNMPPESGKTPRRSSLRRVLKVRQERLNVL